MGTDGRVGADGTQAPAPPPAYTDPLAGLVTGGSPTPVGFGGSTDDVEVEVPDPVEPDPEVVRGMVDAALAGEGEGLPVGRALDASRPAAAAAPVTQFPSPENAGLLQQQRRWSAPQRMRQVLTARRSPGGGPSAPGPEAGQDTGPGPGAETRTPVVPRFGRRAAAHPRPVVRKPSNGSAGVAMAVVLLVVFGLLVVQLISSFVSSVTGLFN
ncbi:hypothetical protein [Amycolatopsis arida]|uniref:hypothetical protein n=1 Tax=Amycolatopsis arida TaxID=587909 RepID=UPI00106691A5|nr:hypothetical protein [Amycolatopsis arida]